MSESAPNDSVLELDAVQVGARWLGMFLATFFLAAVAAPQQGGAGAYLAGAAVMWSGSLSLAVWACIFLSRRRYRQAILMGWLAPFLPLAIYFIAVSR